MKQPTWFVEPFVEEGLGNSAYLVGSRQTKRAVLIDPLRDVDRYLSAAERLGVDITYVLDTHLHADFVSGVREVASRSRAVIGASAESQLAFDHRPLVEGDQISLGDLTLQVMATPGHTPEHISFLLNEVEVATPAALFSGGALIVGGAARTDLLGHDLTDPLTRHLYHTLHHKLLALPDAVNVYPTHGAGSFCVAPSSPDRTTTIGLERKRNPLAQPQTESEFVARALNGLPSYPAYYKEMRPLNQRGPKVLGDVPHLKPLSAEDVRAWIASGGAVLDVREFESFVEAHLPDSYNIPLGTPLVTWAGWLLPFNLPLVLVAEDQVTLEESVRHLIRIGYDDLRGYLEGGVTAWEAAGLQTARVPTMSVKELRERMADDDAPLILDVRSDSEWMGGHIPGAIHIENGRLAVDSLSLPTDRLIAVHCQHGSRSSAGLTTLRRRGYRDLVLVRGGFAAWEKARFEVERG